MVDRHLLGVKVVMEVKCSGKEGVRYGSEAVILFENWLKRVSGFRKAVIARENRWKKLGGKRYQKKRR